MWCLETIVALNEAASQKVQGGKPLIEAYQSVGILIPRSGAMAYQQRMQQNENKELVAKE